MPIGAQPSYPLLEDVMLLARSLVNDTFKGATGTPGEGQIFVDSSTIAPFTIPFLNSALRELGRRMGNNEVGSWLNDNINFIGLGPVNGPMGLGAPDPTIQVSITFAGYNDGSGTLNTGLALPANVQAPLTIWQRQNGTNNPFTEMVQSQNGLPSTYQTSTQTNWEYRQDGIYMNGATIATDIRLRAKVSLPTQVTGAGTDFSSISVPIMDSTDALAWLLVRNYGYRLVGADEEAAFADQQATAQIQALILRQVHQKQAVPYARQPYGGSGYEGGPGNGGGFYGQ